MPLPELCNEALIGYVGAMLRKPKELPPAVARRFVDDMRLFHIETNGIKRDEIAIARRYLWTHACIRRRDLNGRA